MWTMKKGKYQPDHVIQDQVQKIADKFGLSLVMLFGSFANVTNTKESDVDIAYVKTDKLATAQEIELALEFENLFKVERADIVYIPDMSPIFMYMTLNDGIVLFAQSETIFPSFYSYSIQRLYDNMSLYKMRLDHLCKKHQIT